MKIPNEYTHAGACGEQPGATLLYICIYTLIKCFLVNNTKKYSHAEVITEALFFHQKNENNENSYGAKNTRMQVHAEGITEALLFHVDLLASAIRQAVIIKDHKSFLKVHPNTFRGQAAIEWLRGHAG